MSEIICVTNRRLCGEDFLLQIEKIAKASPRGVILREKDLSEADYEKLAREVMEICQRYRVPCILHSFVQTAVSLHAETLHLPLPLLRELGGREKEQFSVLGTSCHSSEEAREAQRLGCTYLTAGHVFATDCKKDLAPRGLDFLREVCQSVSIPVYAIGGIQEENYPSVLQAGAAGACMMSGLMTSSNPEAVLRTLTNLRSENASIKSDNVNSKLSV